MTRKEISDLLPIMQAYVDGKTIQYRVNKEWEDIDNPSFNDLPSEYRIKPEPTYRPFKNIEECWKELQKHHPVGWIKTKTGTQMYGIAEISENSDWKYRFDTYTFADGTPYGIKEE